MLTSPGNLCCASSSELSFVPRPVFLLILLIIIIIIVVVVVVADVVALSDFGMNAEGGRQLI